jgi:diacylglycerol kinase family enzyme
MVQTAGFHTLDIRCDAGLPLATDGEWLGLARQLQVQARPASLQVVSSPS